MKVLDSKVEDCTENFTLKLDRLIKDFKMRFNDFTRFTTHLQHLSSNVDYLKSQNVSKTESTIKEKNFDQAMMKEIRKSVETVEEAIIGLHDEVKKVKTNTNEMDKKLVLYADSKFNPLLEDFANQRKASESIVREYLRTSHENRSLTFQTQTSTMT